MTDGLLGGVIQGSANWDYNFCQLFLLIKFAHVLTKEPDSSNFKGKNIWAMLKSITQEFAMKRETGSSAPENENNLHN